MVPCKECHRKDKPGYNPEYCKICPGTHCNLTLIEELKKDQLTKLGNRHFLKDFLQKYVDYKETYGIIFFDLDNLHTINRKYGYLSGDKYILEFVRKVQEVLPENIIFFRIGGDEFLVILLQQIDKDIKNRLKKLEKYATIAYKNWKPQEDDFYMILNELDREIIIKKQKKINPIIRFIKKLLGCR